MIEVWLDVAGRVARRRLAAERCRAELEARIT
jgi:hypothetical protein